MESRFRKLLLRRDRPTTADENSVVEGLPYQNADPGTHQPIFIYQPLGKSTTELRNSVQANGLPLRSFSYESSAPGKAPVMGARPQKGNGPIKLQTNRRLSNGELIATTQDVQQTLKDIKEGDYIVGKKERPLSQTAQRRSSSTMPQLSLPAGLDSRFGQFRQSLTAPAHSQTWPLATVHESGLSPIIATSTEFAFDHRPGPSSFPAPPPRIDTDASCDPSLQFNQGATPRATPSSYANSFQEPRQEQNATLQALYKAEYSRLVTIYGKRDADKSIAQLDRERMLSQKHASGVIGSSQTMQLLGPLPTPSFDARSLDRCISAISGADSARSSGTWSDDSSRHRQSPTSSCAEIASDMMQPQVDDETTAGTRADVRKMVERMRSTFISAYEEQTPKHVKSKTPKKRRAPKPVATQQATKPSMPTTAPGLGLSQQTWQTTEADTELHVPVQMYPSNSSQSTTPTLSAHPRIEENGIRRADSSTLGTVMSESTREKLKSRHSHLIGSKARDRKSRQSEKSTDGSVEGSFMTASSFQPPTPKHSPDISSDSWLNLGGDSWDEVYAPLSNNYLSSPQPTGPTLLHNDAYTKGTNDSQPAPQLILPHNKQLSISAFPAPPQSQSRHPTSPAAASIGPAMYI